LGTDGRYILVCASQIALTAVKVTIPTAAAVISPANSVQIEITVAQTAEAMVPAVTAVDTTTLQLTT
jgi:hypothetical protein